MIIVDTSAIVAYMNSADTHHQAVRAWVDGVDDDLATTPLIVAETDHLVMRFGGVAAARGFHADLLSGAYLVEWWRDAMASTVRVAERYGDMRLGLADASLVVLAQRLETVTIATLDERHFRAIRPLALADTFRLMPRDA